MPRPSGTAAVVFVAFAAAPYFIRNEQLPHAWLVAAGARVGGRPLTHKLKINTLEIGP